MNWMEKLDSEETKAWQELMVDYAYDWDDWNEAREQLLQLLKIDHRDAAEADLALIYPVVRNQLVPFIHYLT